MCVSPLVLSLTGKAPLRGRISEQAIEGNVTATGDARSEATVLDACSRSFDIAQFPDVAVDNREVEIS